jgi:hypothetical protein
MYTFELTWLLIYASQLDALHDLNSGPLKRKQLRPYYDAVAQKFPDAYRQYSFDGWLGFMRTLVLIREDGDMVSLTIRGQEFLKYLIHTQRSAKGRPY